MFEDLFSQFVLDYAKYVSNSTLISSSSNRLFLCANYFEQPFVS